MRAIFCRVPEFRFLRRATVCAVAASSIGILLVAVSLVGQSRDAYEQAYRDWRGNDPNLERDAARAGNTLVSRTEKAADAARKFILARKAFYEAQRDIFTQVSNTLQPVEFPKPSERAKAAEGFLSNQEASVANGIQIFGGDPDKGIQQLRMALEKERLALAALQSSIKTRQGATEAAEQANANTDRARTAAADDLKIISASFAQSSEDIAPLAEAWPSYYRALAEGARGVGSTAPLPPAAPTSISSISTSNTNTRSTPSPANSAPSPASAGSAARPSPVAPAAVNRGIPPASRYTGSWTFLPGISTYRGLPLVSYDLFVREENGQIFGTVTARFIVATTADADVRFDFSGPLQAQRFQVFPLKTAEGAKGTVELIPGNAFNLLEVNYGLEGAPGKVHDSDVILVKR